MFTCGKAVTLFTLACLWIAVQSDDCPYQPCICDNVHIICQSRGLTEIPPLTGARSGRTYLEMEENSITAIPAGRLPANLTDISLINNPITTIDDSAFADSQHTLATLTFSKARFTRIPDALIILRSLHSLSISDTAIQDWNTNAMIAISSTIQYLSLLNVSLNVWPTWMKNFSNLTDLSLDRNNLSFVPDGAFDMMTNSLTALYLSQNSLTEVPKTVSTLRNVHSLRLDNNIIKDVKWLPHLSRLSDLSLSFNRIADAQQLSQSLLSFSKTLSEFSIFNNQLTQIPDFSFLEGLEYFDLSYNHISDSQSGSLSTIVNTVILDNNFLNRVPGVLSTLPSSNDLVLSNNRLTEIRGIDISVWVNDVDMVNNLITELSDTSFPEKSEITFLDLQNNPIVKISNLAFKNLQSLNVLNMQNSKLTRLPLALSSLSNIQSVDISGSRSLVCTCLEKSLGPWILSRTSGINGNCGEISVHDFFATLSKDCP